MLQCSYITRFNAQITFHPNHPKACLIEASLSANHPTYQLELEFVSSIKRPNGVNSHGKIYGRSTLNELAEVRRG